MLAVVVVLLWLSGGEAWYSARCSEDDQQSTTVTEATDGVKGRYVVEYCTPSTPLPLKWKLFMSTIKTRQERCNNELGGLYAGTPHSLSDEKLNLSATINSSCPYVCLSKPMDLMFHACYLLDNTVEYELNNKTVTPQAFTTVQYVNNNIERYNSSNTSVYLDCQDLVGKVRCTWLEGVIPYTDYTVTLWSDDNNMEDLLVTDNCTRVGGAGGGGAVRCELAVGGAGGGRYHLQLSHVAPWVLGHPDLAHHKERFTYTEPPPEPKKPLSVSRTVIWVCGTASLAAVCIFAGLLAYQKRQNAKITLKAWQEMLARKTELEEESRLKEEPSRSGNILLLYARDCPAVQRVAAALANLLTEHTHANVYDLYSPQLTALAAPAPAAFVRDCMRAPQLRVLLLQTPALAALHTVRLQDTDSFKLECSAPLVSYRAPHFSDTLLQYALSLLAQSPHTEHVSPYNKYFLATLSDLPVDVFPNIVPFTRFELPVDTFALIHELFPAHSTELPPAALEELVAASSELVDYVRDNPNYLAEQLMFL